MTMDNNVGLDMLLSQAQPPLRQRRQRTNFNDVAIERLEVAFALNPYPDINERDALARELKTSEDRVQVWFQNKRARYRKKMHKMQPTQLKKEKQQQQQLDCDECCESSIGSKQPLTSSPAPSFSSSSSSSLDSSQLHRHLQQQSTPMSSFNMSSSFAADSAYFSALLHNLSASFQQQQHSSPSPLERSSTNNNSKISFRPYDI